MSYKIKLKVGFFKTQLCTVEINSQQISLIPQENGAKSIIIKNDALKTAGFITNDNRGDEELEIVTVDATYRGTLVDKNDFTDLSQVLYQEFGKKFILHKGTLS